MKKQNNLFRHLLLLNTAKVEKFRSAPSFGSKSQLPNVDRHVHGKKLLNQIEVLKTNADKAKKIQEDAGFSEGFGLQIQFKSLPQAELVLKSLERGASGIELLNVKKVNDLTFATVFVPDGKLKIFEKIILDYLDEKKDKNAKPRNKAFLNTIDEIRTAELNALWTDKAELMPENDEEKICWEVWLSIRNDRKATIANFRNIATQMGFECIVGEIEFPERIVLLMKGTKKQIKQSGMLLNAIAELRLAKETAEFFDSLVPIEQRDWIHNLLTRTTYLNGDIPYICILDTGVNNGHPLIQSVLHSDDQHSVEPNQGTYDEHGHGTEMAGVTLFGDLTEVLESTEAITVNHKLESVKLLSKPGDNKDRNYGHITAEAIARSEIQAPKRRRVFNLAITAKDDRDRGRPSAWSGALDRLASDYDGDGLSPRLIIVSAGNVNDSKAWMDYPHSNASDGIHDPGQAWNILTVGAYTEKNNITEPNTAAFKPIAPQGTLSPFSTTSMTWTNRLWPLKPDVVLEGGNAAKDINDAFTIHSLNLLTTYHKIDERLFTTTHATSAATALCSGMAAKLMALYSDYWPETIRGLIIHSAEWTDQMKDMFKTGKSEKDQYCNLIKHCGFGVPNLEQAMWSASNSLTLIIQENLQPFEKDKYIISTCDMHLHEIPWPLSELQALGETPVEMRVTLSYFIEPNPAAREFRDRYCYESHGLRFDVKRPLESLKDFRGRINRLARDEENGAISKTTDPNWLLGTQLRHRGSLHSDIWKGTAAELAERGIIGVYPTLGWWKTRTKLQRYEKKARYSLVVSIRAPKINVDLYTPIENRIKQSVQIS